MEKFWKKISCLVDGIHMASLRLSEFEDPKVSLRKSTSANLPASLEEIDRPSIQHQF